MSSKVSVVLHLIWKPLCFKWHSRPKACLTKFFHSKIAKEVKRWQQPFFDHIGEGEDFLLGMLFLDKGLKRHQWTVRIFLEQNHFWRVYLWLQRQQAVTLVKMFGARWKQTPLGLIKSAWTRRIKTSNELPAGAGKIPPITCGNRTQSLPAEIFACICRFFYSLSATIAGKFARASFTVYVRRKLQEAGDFECEK